MNELISRAAYINAQTVCALAEIEGMKAENAQRAIEGHSPAWSIANFLEVPQRYGIHHNAVIGYLS